MKTGRSSNVSKTRNRTLSQRDEVSTAPTTTSPRDGAGNALEEFADDLFDPGNLSHVIPRRSKDGPDDSSIFDDEAERSSTSPVAIDKNASEDRDFWTRDIISLSDVPLSSDEHVRNVDLLIDGKIQPRPGKIIRRVGPHPNLVRVGNRVAHRDELSSEELKGDVKPVMTRFITTVVYEGGVVRPIHSDVLHVIIGLWHERYVQTGVATEAIVTSRAEIARRLGIGVNQRARKHIEDALATVRGVTITKNFESPEGTPANNGERKEVIGGIISAYVIERRSGETPRGGRRSDVITIDLNPALVRALCGDGKDRPWMVRSYNLSRNMRYQTAWKRQLHRMVETRLEHQGRFQMPLIELWVHCLGGSPDDPQAANRWRLIRHRLKEVFDEWEESGWIKNFDWKPQHQRDRASHRRAVVGQQTLDIALGEGRRGNIIVDRPEDEDSGGWLYCESGPNFNAGMGQNKTVLAWDIAKATTTSMTQAERLVKDLGKDFIVDIGYGRLKQIVTHMGDRITRVEMDQWLGRTFPQPSRKHLVRLNYNAWKFVRMQAQFNDGHSLLPATFDDRRNDLIKRVIAKALANFPIDELIADPTGYLESARPADKSLLMEFLACHDLAVTMYLENSDNLSLNRTILDQSARLGDARLESEHAALQAATKEIATAAAAQAMWFKRVSELPRLRELGTLEEHPVPKTLRLEVMRRMPDAFELVKRMQQPGKKTWEAYLGLVFERRLAERVVEEDELQEVEKRRING